MAGNLDVVKRLLASGAENVNAADANGWTALHWAASKGKLDVLMSLLGFRGIDLNVQNNEGNTPLHIAVAGWSNTGQVIDCLLEARASPELPNRAGQTPTTVAYENRRFGIAQIFCQHSKKLLRLAWMKACVAMASSDAGVSAALPDAPTSGVASILLPVMLADGIRMCIPHPPAGAGEAPSSYVVPSEYGQMVASFL